MLDAGSVMATLGGRFDPAAFRAFDSAMKKTAAETEAGEARIRAASNRMANAMPLKAMDQWSKHSKQTGENLEKAGKVATTVAAVGILAVGAATAYAVTKAVSFNQEMLKISTQAGGTRAEVKSLSQEILGMAGTVPQGPKELAESLYHVESAGFRGAQALGMVKAAAKGAALGNANLEDTTQAMIATTASRIKGVHGEADAMGQLNAIVGVGDMRMEQLAQAMATGILPSAHDAGLSLKDVGAALATVTDNATPANVTATRLRMTIALLAAPSAAATKQLKSIGLTSTSLAHDMRQPNGLLLAVEDLKTHLKDSGKTAEEQDAILSHVFGGGKSSAVIHTLISETDRLRSKYQELGSIDGPKRLEQSWAEFQKSGKADFAELKSAGEAFAVTVGNTVLPELTKLAKGASSTLSEFQKSGGAAKVGDEITHGFDTAGQVISGLAPDIEAVARALLDAGRGAEAVGQFFGLGLAGQIETAATALIAFKAASFALPIVAAGLGAVSQGLFLVSAAAADGELLALPGILLSMTNPLTAIATVVGIAAAGFVAFQSGLFSSTSAAEKNAKAVEADKKAIEELNKATQTAAAAGTAAKRAELDRKEAGENLKKVQKEIHEGDLKGAAATNALTDAQLRYAEASEKVTTAHEKAQAARRSAKSKAEEASITTSKREDEKLEEIGQEEELAESLRKRGASAQELAPTLAKINQLEAERTKLTREGLQAGAEVYVSEESRRRIEAGKSAIKPANAQGVQALEESLTMVPDKIRTKYELDDQDAQAKLGTLAGKLNAVGKGVFVTKVLTTAPTAQAAIEAFTAATHGVPTSKILKVLASTSNAQEQIIALKALIAGVPASKVIHILTTAPSAQAGVASLRAEIAALENKTITVTAIIKTAGHVGAAAVKGLAGFASGRDSGPREAALVREGQGDEYVIDSRTGEGRKVTSPTLMGLGSDDYVIPLEQRYRGRALGLFAMLARDLEIPGYKAGRGSKKQAKHKKLPVPDAIPPLSLPLSDIEQKEQTAKGRYEKAAKKVTGLEGKIKTAERNLKYAGKKGTTRAKDRSKLAELQKELRKAKKSSDYVTEHKKMEEWKHTLADAKRFQTQINDARLQAENATNSMKLASDHNDPSAYGAAKNQRLTALGKLKGLIQKAQKEIKTGSEYALQMEGQLQQAQIETESTTGEEIEPPKSPAAEREAQSGMTDAEAAQLKGIDKDIALAALTPDLGDDKTQAERLSTFLQGVLNEAIAEPQVRGGDEMIASLAQSLKTAQENVISLTTGGTQNQNQDLQAQINQANERAEVAKREAQIANQALAVFGGSGDIGAGGGNAAQAAGGVVIHQTNNMLHPSDPSVLATIGNAATAGIGMQGSRRAVRFRPGI